MTILQRYGLFTVVPGVIFMLIVGLVLLADSEDDQPGDTPSAQTESAQLHDEPVEPTR